MKKIIVSQRLDKIISRGEYRDNLDIKIIEFTQKLSLMPISLSNGLSNTSKFLSIIKPKGAIITGGGNPKIKNLRYKNEINLIKYCIKFNIPILGICRGAQILNIFFGGKLAKVKNHVKKRHTIIGKVTNNKEVEVNSFHEMGFKKKHLSSKLNPLAICPTDGVVECFDHKKQGILGIMWHPEREKKFKKFDLDLIKFFFK